jgi:hypothetical protein
MAVQLNTYAGLQAGMLAWRGRVGDTLLSARFDDFLANCEDRMYYGFATEDMGNPLRSDPLRIVEMETVNGSFALLTNGPQADSTPAPAGFLELISMTLAAPLGPMQVVSQSTIDGLTNDVLGVLPGPGMLAISGTNFRVFPPPGTGAFTAVLRYYQSLATPTGSTVNAILTNYSSVYLYGVLIEAAIFEQDTQAAQQYLGLYNAQVSGLNARTQRITASARPMIRVRAGMVV